MKKIPNTYCFFDGFVLNCFFDSFVLNCFSELRNKDT